ncbi:MAG: hypothetical protein ACI399_07320 [Candidatus Cryptobacteroides sp.]
MQNKALIFLATLLLALLPSCKTFNSLVHDGEVVARYGSQKLYRSELEKVIPAGLSPEDSATLAVRYIESWAKDKAFLAIAGQMLTKEEKDCSKDLESYKESLLKYRFEQRYINERLDTTVSDTQLKEYYEGHKEIFRLPRTIFKAKFIKLPKDSPDFATFKKLMASNDSADVAVCDSMALNSALHYHDFSESWIDAADLAAEFDLDPAQMMAKRNGSSIELVTDAAVSYAHIFDSVREWEIPPVEFCSSRIRDILISERKHSLLMTLERDLLDEVRTSDKFEIYSE